ncbi:hypothetical protein [Winogradskyella sp.]|uniref:hypothetical protein n=1 Tax=Winogradskyella sp. TaxID=1883156 RepID=UPI003F6D00C8
MNVNKAPIIEDLDKFCDCFGYEDFNIKYLIAVDFRLPKNKRIAQALQWNSDILVYLDKSIPKKTRKRFVNFFKQINGINNFRIAFSKKLKNANYLIRVSDSTIPNKKTKTKEYDEYHPFSKVTYNLLNDNNDKLYAGILEIDKSVLHNDSLTLKKLKQMFFMSLGAFVMITYMPYESLLSPTYESSEKISELDLKLLRTHYYYIYPGVFHRADILKLREQAKLICNND